MTKKDEHLKVLYSEDQIRERIRVLGEEITEFYQGKDLTVIAILNGSVPFAADLIRAIRLPLWLDSMAVSSYTHDRSAGVLTIRNKPKCSFRGRHVLLVDDILDTGGTIRQIKELLNAQGALSIRSCVLLDKELPEKRKECKADWFGFRMPECFAIGYGLDYDEDYRNLPYIAVKDL